MYLNGSVLALSMIEDAELKCQIIIGDKVKTYKSGDLLAPVDDEFGFVCIARESVWNVDGLHALRHFKKERVDELMMTMQWHACIYGMMMVSKWGIMIRCQGGTELGNLFVCSYPRQSTAMLRTGPKQGHHGN
ncbi:hypothetical protein VNO78_08088 [Psophocarpus tetragonolobus]|uniref:Uncharacterized protein n=1 Tax=Psophocarpus tetragonolobus TaxID=3891 RepID=A0AAN9XSA2_PSOTE